ASMRILGFALSSPVINRLKKPLNSVLRRPNMDALLSSPEQPGVASTPPARRQGPLCLHHHEETSTVTNRRQLRDRCQRDQVVRFFIRSDRGGPATGSIRATSVRERAKPRARRFLAGVAPNLCHLRDRDN